jgi:hypothetical protein
MFRPQHADHRQVHAGLLNHSTHRHNLLGLAPVLIVLRAAQAAAEKKPRNLGTFLRAIIVDAV